MYSPYITYCVWDHKIITPTITFWALDSSGTIIYSHDEKNWKSAPRWMIIFDEIYSSNLSEI